MFSAARLGDRIRARREALRLKQVDVANALQVTPQAVSKWERGENAPDIAVLVPLAQLFGVSTDTLLGYHEIADQALEATVMFCDVAGTSRRVHAMQPSQSVTWINGLYYQLTETVLQRDGVPIQYSGDSFLCFFAGEDHGARAVGACRDARSVLSDRVHMGLNSGTIHPCAVGHPDYATSSLAVGDTTILTYRVMEWAARHTDSGMATTHATVASLDDDGLGEVQSACFPDFDNPVEVCEIR